jgi:hypothetical protein
MIEKNILPAMAVNSGTDGLSVDPFGFICPVTLSE